MYRRKRDRVQLQLVTDPHSPFGPSHAGYAASAAAAELLVHWEALIPEPPAAERRQDVQETVGVLTEWAGSFTPVEGED